MQKQDPGIAAKVQQALDTKDVQATADLISQKVSEAVTKSAESLKSRSTELAKTISSIDKEQLQHAAEKIKDTVRRNPGLSALAAFGVAAVGWRLLSRNRSQNLL